MWDLVISAAASALGGYLSGQGAEAAGKAEANAANAATELNRQIYNDQRALSLPGYYTGGAAANKLAALYGIAPQNYGAAALGSMASNGNMLSSNLGAGQAVAGHSSGGSGNQWGGLGTQSGSGGLLTGIGSALGINKPDNWQTVATEAPAGYDYTAYLQQPDLAAEWAKPDIKALFGNNPDAYANWHYNQFGKNEGRTLNPTTGASTGTDTGTGTGTDTTTGGTTQGGTQAASDPLGEFMSSAYNKLATETSAIDFGKIKGQLGAAGKSLSGAGEGRYAKTLAGNRYGAFGDYTNGLRSMAGMNQTATSNIGSAGATYGSNAGQSIMAAGQAKGNALAGAYKGYGDGVAGSIGAVNDYGKKNWGWG
jgi:hypothetical protein